MAAHNDTGKWGEDLAAKYLEEKGYTIVERDWKSGRRDIDIIALDDDVVVFVEVKTRRNRLYGETGHQPLRKIQAYPSGDPFRHHLHCGYCRNGS